VTTYKVAELIGWRLDLAVALARGATNWTFNAGTGDAGDVFASFDGFIDVEEFGRKRATRSMELTHFSPSTDWFDGGPIIERERISLTARNPLAHSGWDATNALAGRGIIPTVEAEGLTPLVAAMRAYLLVNVGQTVELPA